MFDYGEKLYLINRYYRKYGSFRYRMDPVPGINRFVFRFRSWYKKPRHAQERKWYYSCPELIRRKRSPYYIPDDWNDYPRADIKTRRSWKNKKIKKQWEKNRGF